MLAADVDEPPRPVGGNQGIQTKVEYPVEARRRGISGEVLVSAVIDTEGQVVWVGLERSVHPLLDAAAVEAVRASSFTPGVKDGEAVPVRITYPVSFRVR